MRRPIITVRLAALILAALGASVATAQPEDAAPDGSAWVFDPPPEPPVVRLAQSTESISRPAVVEAPKAGPGVNANKRGLLQSVAFVADWAPRLEDDSLGRSTLSASIGTGVPPSLLGTPILITPRAAIHLVDGPGPVDTPARLNDLEVSFATFRKLSERWMARLSVSVGVYGDDHSLGDADALRVSGVGVAIFNQSPRWQWAIGAAYLNRDDIAVVPAVGVIYNAGEVRYELMMPRPRIVWSLPQDSGGRDRALYLAGELGGGAWAVERTDGTTDTLNLSRFGLLLGYEKSSTPTLGLWSWGGWNTRYEIGYLFGRNLEYADGGEDFSLDDSLVMRVGWAY